MKTVKILVTGLLMTFSAVAFGQTATYQVGQKIVKMKPCTACRIQMPPFGLSFTIDETKPDETAMSNEVLGFVFAKPELCKVGTIPISNDVMIIVASMDSQPVESGKIVIKSKKGDVISGTYEATTRNSSFKGTFENITIK
jgi:hypothetical protein